VIRSPGFILHAIVLLALYAAGCDLLESDSEVYQTAHAARAEFHFTLPERGIDRLEIEAVNGPIAITAAAPDSAPGVSGERMVSSNSREDARNHLEELEVRCLTLGRTVLLQTRQPRETSGRSYIVSYKVRIPSSWSLGVDLVNGLVTIDSMRSKTDVQLVNGDVALRGLSGDVTAHMVNGSVLGSVILPPQGRLVLETVNGAISLALPRSTSAQFGANVENGRIHFSELPLQDIRSNKKALYGRLGEGEGTIALKSVNGSILVQGY